MLKPTKGFTMSTVDHRRDSLTTFHNPGPGDYDYQLPSPAYNVGFSQSPTKSYLDEEIMRKGDLPGPGDYEVVKRGGRNIRGGRFRVSDDPSDLERAMAKARDLPGPGDYSPHMGGGGSSTDTVMAPFLEQLKRISRAHLMDMEMGRNLLVSNPPPSQPPPQKPLEVPETTTTPTPSLTTHSFLETAAGPFLSP